jgi:hypothetical protein
MQCYTVAVLLFCTKWLRCVHLTHVMTYFFVKTLVISCNSIQNYEYIATFVVDRPFNKHISQILSVNIDIYNVQMQCNFSHLVNEMY